MAKNKVELILTGDAKSASRAFGDVERAAGGLGGKLGTLGQHLGKIAVAFAGLVVAKAVGGYLIDAGKAAAADAESQAKLANVVTNVTGATTAQIGAMESWITKMQMATGISDSAMRPALQNLVVATKSVSEAEGLMGVAMDISVAKGLDLETVTKAMAKAHDGNAGALQKLGINTKDASGKTLEFDQIMQNASTTFGGAAATAAETLSGKTKRIGEMFGEAKESLGAVFLPVLDQFMTWVTDNMPAIQAGFDTAFGAISTVVGWLADNVLPPLMTALSGLFNWVTSNLPAIQQGFETAWQGIADIISPIAETVVPAVKEALIAFRDWWEGGEGSPKIVAAWGAIGTAVEGVRAIVDDIVVPEMKDKMAELRAWIDEHGNAVKQTFGSVAYAAMAIVTVVRDNWPVVSEVIGRVVDLASKPLNDFMTFFGDIFEGISGVIDLIKGDWPNISTPIHAAWAAISGPLGALKQAFEDIANAIQWALDKLNLWNRTPAQTKTMTLNSSGSGLNFPYAPKTSVAVPHFAGGGMVPGTGPMLAVVHGGERVLTPAQQRTTNMGGVNIYVTGSSPEATGDAVVRRLMALGIA